MSIIPKAIANYKYVSLTAIDRQQSNYVYAVYKDGDGNKAFLKSLAVIFKPANVRWLKNEVSVCRYISNTIQKDNKIRRLKVRCPNVIASTFVYGENYGLFEYIDGIQLTRLNSKDKVGPIIRAIQFLNGIPLDISPKYKFIVRGNVFMLVLMPIVAVRCLLKNSKLFPKILKGVISFYNASIELMILNKMVLAHRDIGNWNVYIKGNEVVLIDFQLASLANPFTDIVIALLKLWEEKETVTEIINHEYVVSLVSNPSNKKIFKATAIFAALRDLGFADGGPKKVAVDYLNYFLNY